MGLSINDLCHYMERMGYRITPYGVKYYIQNKLLPTPIKQSGGYKKGVRLIFPDSAETLTQLKRIFELKGLGYKLAEIKKVVKEEADERFRDKQKRIQEKFIEINGQYVRVLDDEAEIDKRKNDPDEPWTDDLEKVLFDFLHYVPVVKGDSVNVIDRKLHLPMYLYQDKPVYLNDDIHEALSWVSLRREQDITWDTLEALKKKHIENYETHFFLPDVDGIKFSQNRVNWIRQRHLNEFGLMLDNYIGKIINKTIDSLSMKWENFGEPVTSFWDHEYGNIDSFINGFLEGKCTFVPTYDANIRYFLKKLSDGKKYAN
jgi:DNA-binding transcriptional MerR regulator